MECKKFLCINFHHATVLNPLIGLSNFLVASLGFSKYGIMSFATRDSFASFPIWITFISFSSLIAMAITSKNMLNNSGESGHSYVIPDLTANAFSFSPLRVMFDVSFSYMVIYDLYYVEGGSFYALFLESFFFLNHKWLFNFVESFFGIY